MRTSMTYLNYGDMAHTKPHHETNTSSLGRVPSTSYQHISMTFPASQHSATPELSLSITETEMATLYCSNNHQFHTINESTQTSIYYSIVDLIHESRLDDCSHHDVTPSNHWDEKLTSPHHSYHLPTTT